MAAVAAVELTAKCNDAEWAGYVVYPLLNKKFVPCF